MPINDRLEVVMAGLRHSRRMKLAVHRNAGGQYQAYFATGAALSLLFIQPLGFREGEQRELFEHIVAGLTNVRGDLREGDLARSLQGVDVDVADDIPHDIAKLLYLLAFDEENR
jgi:hypothetical protein